MRKKTAAQIRNEKVKARLRGEKFKINLARISYKLYELNFRLQNAKSKEESDKILDRFKKSIGKKLFRDFLEDYNNQDNIEDYLDVKLKLTHIFGEEYIADRLGLKKAFKSKWSGSKNFKKVKIW